MGRFTIRKDATTGEYSVTVSGTVPAGEYSVTTKETGRANLDDLTDAVGDAAGYDREALPEAAFKALARKDGEPTEAEVETAIETLRTLDRATRYSRIFDLSESHRAVPLYRAIKARFGAGGRTTVRFIG